MEKNPLITEQKLDSYIGANKALNTIKPNSYGTTNRNYIPLLTKHQNEFCCSKEQMMNAIVKLPESAWEKPYSVKYPIDVDSKDKEDISDLYSMYHNGIQGDSGSRGLQTRSKFMKAQINARIYGGAVIIVQVDDGQHWSQPVNFNKIKKVSRLLVRTSNHISLDLGKKGNFVDIDDCEFYRINIKDDAVESLNDKHGAKYDHNSIHKSRIIRFDGYRMPDEWMINKNNGWGLSLSDSIYPEYERYEKALNQLDRILDTFSRWMYGMQDLNSILQDIDIQSEKLLKERFNIFNKLLDKIDGIVIDNNEKFEWVTQNINGLDNLVEVLLNQWVASTGIPRTKLLGVSPSGLGASGESEQKDWDAVVSEFRAKHCEPALAQLDELIFHSKDGPTKGVPFRNGYTYVWPTTLRVDENMKRQSRATDTSTLQTLLMSNMIVDSEARSVLKEQEWWPELVLDDEAWEKSKEEPEGGEVGALPEDYYNQFYGEQESPEQPQQPPEDEQANNETQEQVNQYDSYIWSNSDNYFADEALHREIVQEAKIKFKVWPSSYSNAWVVEQYQVRGGAIARSDSAGTTFDNSQLYSLREKHRAGILDLETLDSRIGLLTSAEKIDEIDNIKELLSTRVVDVNITPSCPELWPDDDSSFEDKFKEYKRRYYDNNGNFIGILK